ncbi:MAG: N-acetyl-gamma-glutamyl-phosphate reductase [Chloroflexi bacterium]|nr:N-acetyl-gamma-glutamyl-phosphate reductase [Chloroflexota bacterium]
MIRVGVYGATGYAGFELVKLLHAHGQVEIGFASSESHTGKRLCEVYPTPLDYPLVAPSEAPLGDVDVAFLCTPHGVSAKLAAAVLGKGVKCIDFSADLRLHDLATYETWYTKHTAPELLPEAVYGLCEVYRERIAGARLIANPGCYTATALLALYPAARAGWLPDGPVIIDAKSGVSGAGVKPTDTTHFCSVHGNLSTYNVGHKHRHVPEIEQELAEYSGHACRIVFTPHLLPVSRGILETIYLTTPPEVTLEALHACYSSQYAGEPFVQLLPLGQGSTLAHVVNTNRCTISLHSAGAPGEFIIVSVLDNLLKGAGGQAVQNMNIMFGLPETMGLE